MTASKARSIAKLFVALATLTLLATGYYALAQSVDLPGAADLRSRWQTQTSYRGTSGHRSHGRRDAGPIECGRLVMVALAFGAGALSFRRKAKTASATPPPPPIG
ncbi:MAG: hypothetical protein JNK63_03895 [Chthonomonas sp.]|nr:hypothetical protein [Chthonomonas sp.]